MSVFVDTSALLATVDADDAQHGRARRAWDDLTLRHAQLTCSSYVFAETYALVQNRLGIRAVRVLHVEIAPILRVVWIGVDIHDQAMKALLLAARRRLSLVDCTSFEIMQRLGIRTAFTFDPHFAEQGFDCVPQ